MKNLSVLLLCIFLIFVSCNKDDENSSKPEVTSFEDIQENSQITFNFSADTDIQYYEISYAPSTGTDNYDPEHNSTIFTTSNQSTVTQSIVLETEIDFEYYSEYFFFNKSSRF